MATITLSDGRILAFAEYGDPAGKPVFFFHGTPGSRFFRPPDEITHRLGVRLVCFDRPGYGESAFQQKRTLLNWPKDVAQVADHLGISRFAVAGHSGGGPHTLACAYALPDRIIAAATISGAGPVDAPGATVGMTSINKFGFKFGRYVPWPIGYFLIWLIYHNRCSDPAKAMDNDKGKRPLADDELIEMPEVRNTCLQSELEAFRPGIKGMAWDVRLITSPWKFLLHDIKGPVHLWHGTTDDLTSVPMVRYMAQEIPNSHLTLFEGEAHLLLFPHWEQILSDLVSE